MQYQAEFLITTAQINKVVEIFFYKLFKKTPFRGKSHLQY